MQFIAHDTGSSSLRGISKKKPSTYPRLVIPVFQEFIFGAQKQKKTGILRISFFSCVFRRNFSQELGFGGGHRNSCFLPISQEFFAGIPVGQEFLYLPRIPPDSSGFLRIPVPAKSMVRLMKAFC
jgi:hypothetical protein